MNLVQKIYTYDMYTNYTAHERIYKERRIRRKWKYARGLYSTIFCLSHIESVYFNTPKYMSKRQ